MSVQTIRSWYCDRCQTQADSSPTEQPAGWGAVLTWDPPLMSPDDAQDAAHGNERAHLCRRCFRAVREFILESPGDVDDRGEVPLIVLLLIAAVLICVALGVA